MSIKDFIEQESHHLSKNTLLDEGINPFVSKMIIFFSFIIFACFIIWSHYMIIDEVSLAEGQISPIDTIIKVQHIDGGMIQKILVKEGDPVEKGQILVKMDDKILKGQLKQAKTKYQALKEKKKYLGEQTRIRKNLFEKGLNSKISYLSIQSDLSGVTGNIDETKEIVNRYSLQIKRTILKSPIPGKIHSIKFEHSGAIIEPGQVIMEILPNNLQLKAEVQIPVDEIGHVSLKQMTTLKFTTYDYAKYGGPTEKLHEISPTTFINRKGKPYYRGIIILSQAYLNNNKQLPIIQGMTLTAEIKTGRKTILEYLLKPLFSSAQKAFKEK